MDKTLKFVYVDLTSKNENYRDEIMEVQQNIRYQKFIDRINESGGYIKVCMDGKSIEMTELICDAELCAEIDAHLKTT